MASRKGKQGIKGQVEALVPGTPGSIRSNTEPAVPESPLGTAYLSQMTNEVTSWTQQTAYRYTSLAKYIWICNVFRSVASCQASCHWPSIVDSCILHQLVPFLQFKCCRNSSTFSFSFV